jgi:hypothetical protein
MDICCKIPLPTAVTWEIKVWGGKSEIWVKWKSKKMVQGSEKKWETCEKEGAK